MFILQYLSNGYNNSHRFIKFMLKFERSFQNFNPLQTCDCLNDIHAVICI